MTCFPCMVDQDEQRPTRAARRDKKLLWPNGIVYYKFHSSVDTAMQNIIRGAIREIERETCLDFRVRTRQSDYIEFTGEGSGCSSSSIGKGGGKQFIRLPVFDDGSTCRTHGITVHEIGHAIGIWHEQSRPDRDQ